MKEYGGYIELDTYSGEEFYPEAWALNSGRSALRLLIRLRGIKKIYLPAFCCSTVWEACEAEGISWEFYSIDKDFCPIFSRTLNPDEWFYLVNFYGVFTDADMQDYRKRIPRLIADYTHAFFQRPLEGVDVLYSCRKFFGVPDGAYLFLGEGKTENKDTAEAARTNVQEMYDRLPQDSSYERMHFLLGRYEAGASPFYHEYAQNNEIFSKEPVKKMSPLTHNLLRAVDYSKACRRRTENFAFLHRMLKEKNALNLPEIIPGAYAYPFLYKQKESLGRELRQKLIQQKVYVPTLWPEVKAMEAASPLERDLAEHILPLPIDQRYTETEMNEILEMLLGML